MTDINVAVIENGLRQISLSGRVAKGLTCTVKAIIKGKARLVFLADDCENKDYKALITGLCKKHGVKLVQVPSRTTLGKALGLTCLRADGTVRRQINCSSCALIKYGGVVTPHVEEFRNAFDPVPENEQQQE